jgi:hypothetical protein
MSVNAHWRKMLPVVPGHNRRQTSSWPGYTGKKKSQNKTSIPEKEIGTYPAPSLHLDLAPLVFEDSATGKKELFLLRINTGSGTYNTTVNKFFTYRTAHDVYLLKTFLINRYRSKQQM